MDEVFVSFLLLSECLWFCTRLSGAKVVCYKSTYWDAGTENCMPCTDLCAFGMGPTTIENCKTKCSGMFNEVFGLKQPVQTEGVSHWLYTLIIPAVIILILVTMYIFKKKKWACFEKIIRESGVQEQPLVNTLPVTRNGHEESDTLQLDIASLNLPPKIRQPSQRLNDRSNLTSGISSCSLPLPEDKVVIGSRSATLCGGCLKPKVFEDCSSGCRCEETQLAKVTTV